jgi:hypothetical protein
VEQAKKAHIERAIRKGAGLDTEGVHYTKLTYEGFAPHRQIPPALCFGGLCISRISCRTNQRYVAPPNEIEGNSSKPSIRCSVYCFRAKELISQQRNPNETRVREQYPLMLATIPL